jgi:iron complex outermembrane receptor protein
MKVTLLVLVACLALVSPLSAQSLSGHIVDASTAAPLRARVAVVDTQQSVTADEAGRFTVQVGSAPRVTLAFSLDGYYVQRINVDVTTTSTLEVHLAPIVSVNDRVEVTATRARDGIDPVSFTNVPKERVAEAYWAQDPAMLLAQIVPGFYATNDSGNGIGYSYFSIRGFGQARTRVMLNGAPLNDAESGELFFIDLADFMSTSGDVQVQRGVFGLSGLGGAVDITTALPSVTPSFNVSTGAGSYNTRRFAVNWDSGLIDNRWAMSARYSKITTDGYRDQSWVDMWNYYLALARYGGRSRLQLVLFGGPERTHLAYEGVSRDALDGRLTGDAERDRRSNPITYPGEIDNFLQPHYQLLHDLDLTSSTHLSQTVYLFQGDGYYDQFRARRSFFEYNLPNVTQLDGSVITKTDLVRRRNVDEWDAGWVPSLRHTAGRWSLGLQGEVRIHRAHHEGTVTWAQDYPTGFAPNQHYYDYRTGKETASIAGDVRFAATSRLSLSGGGQYTHHRYSVFDDRMKGVDLAPTYNFVLPRAGAVLTLDPSANVYARVARGMREPFLRSIYDPQDYYGTPVSLDPEDVWNVESGVSVTKPRWRARGNVFWMSFINEIVYAGALDDNGVPIYGNGARSRRLGAEVDGSVSIGPCLTMDGALSVSRNTFTQYREYDFEGGSVVYDGNRIAGFPDVMASVSLRGEWRGAHAAVSLRRVGRFYLDNTQSAGKVNDAYTTVDASSQVSIPAAWSRSAGLSRMALTVRVNNLFDQRYTTFGYIDGGPLYIPAAGRNVFVGFTLRL